jgi:hypothetical protein
VYRARQEDLSLRCRGVRAIHSARRTKRRLSPFMKPAIGLGAIADMSHYSARAGCPTSGGLCLRTHVETRLILQIPKTRRLLQYISPSAGLASSPQVHTPPYRPAPCQIRRLLQYITPRAGLASSPHAHTPPYRPPPCQIRIPVLPPLRPPWMPQPYPSSSRLCDHKRLLTPRQ